MAFDRLKLLLKDELGYLPSDTGLDELFSRGEMLRLSQVAMS